MICVNYSLNGIYRLLSADRANWSQLEATIIVFDGPCLENES
jgi:hypothetical protein